MWTPPGLEENSDNVNVAMDSKLLYEIQTRMRWEDTPKEKPGPGKCEKFVACWKKQVDGSHHQGTGPSGKKNDVAQIRQVVAQTVESQ
jgi:hypothetical protein